MPALMLGGGRSYAASFGSDARAGHLGWFFFSENIVDTNPGVCPKSPPTFPLGGASPDSPEFRGQGETSGPFQAYLMSVSSGDLHAAIESRCERRPPGCR